LITDYDVYGERRLVGVECKPESDDEARGWRALPTDENEVVTYCPECAAREFDDE
jgi:hypothetical protein